MVVTKTLLQRRHMKRCSTWRKNLKIINIFLQDSSAREDDDQLSPSIKTDLTCSSPLKQCPTFMTYPTTIFNIWRSNWLSVCMIMNCVIDLSTPPYDPIVSESLSVSLSNHQLSILCLSISSSIQQITVRYLFPFYFTLLPPCAPIISELIKKSLSTIDPIHLCFYLSVFAHCTPRCCPFLPICLWKQSSSRPAT